MFGLFKKKKNKEIKGFYSIMNGKSIDLSQVDDEMFSNKVLGDGIAIEPTSSTVVSPCDGEVTLVSETKHAIGLKNQDGIEVLIHIGLDTVKLNGVGFKSLCEAGDKISVGQPLVNVDRDLLKEKNISDTTMMVLIEANGYKISNYHTDKVIESGKSLLLEYE